MIKPKLSRDTLSNSKNPSCRNASPGPVGATGKSGNLADQVSLLTLMVGNLAEKSLALAAILTATWRATAL